MIQYLFIQITEKHCIVIGILLFVSDMPKYHRSIDCFCKSPVHAVMNDRVSLPVCSIDDTRCTVCVPCIFDRPLIEIRQQSHIFQSSSIFRCIFHRICPLRDQSCPFDTMTRCCAIGFERIVRMILVTVRFGVQSFRKCSGIRQSLWLAHVRT